MGGTGTRETSAKRHDTSMLSSNRKIRIGIDVGGTFTHAVALYNDTYELAGKIKVPTSHSSKKGVAEGIVSALKKLLKDLSINPKDVSFIAHSTTQATNALLEGDVAPVGIIGMGKGMDRFRAKNETDFGVIEIAEGKYLDSLSYFLDTTYGLEEEILYKIFDSFKRQGINVIVASEAFSVDNPENEKKVVHLAKKEGFLATGTHEISQLYGLRVRTRTATINASILHKMMETCIMTEESVKEAGITAPLMIMRSDGGVMSVEEVKNRPVLTILSGPAAGVAAALMYERISDGIFLDVGGTSTDISVIQLGQAKIKPATIEGHRLYLNTLDISTLGIAGGSMVRCSKNKITDVGPRSAHIAGLPYCAFEEVNPSAISSVKPLENDPEDYLAVKGKDKNFALTPTCASNLLGLVPKGDPAEGKTESLKKVFSFLSEKLNTDEKAIAHNIMKIASQKVINKIKELIKTNRMPEKFITLTGGGGGAAALIPYVAKAMGLKWKIAENNDVISAIGVAMAMVREVVEKSVISPGEEDIIQVRREGEEKAISAGALAGTVEVQIEVDSQRNIIRAIATGSTELREKELGGKELDESSLKEKAALSMEVSRENVQTCGKTAHLRVFLSEVEEKLFLGLFKRKGNELRVIDNYGVIRLQLLNGISVQTGAGFAPERLKNLIKEHISYGDGGTLIPPVYFLLGSRIINLSHLQEINRIISLVNMELKGINGKEEVVILLEKI